MENPNPIVKAVAPADSAARAFSFDPSRDVTPGDIFSTRSLGGTRLASL